MGADRSRRWRGLLEASRPNRLVKVLSGAPLVWLFLGDDGSDAAAIHRTFSRQVWRHAGVAERLLLLVGTLLWFPATPALVAVCVARAGAGVKMRTGKGIVRQVREQLRLAYFSGIPAPWYYVFELYDDAKRARALEYLYRQETKDALYDVLRSLLSRPSSTNALSDKAEFVRRCEKHGLPVITAVAVADGGRIEFKDGRARELPPLDLFFKPLRGAGGRGAARWCYCGNGLYRDHQGRELFEHELAVHLKLLSANEPYMVRPSVRNHGSILDLSRFALSTVRVVTIQDDRGRTEVTHAVMRMARNSDVVVDNFHAGGVAAKVDLATGALGRATDMGLAAGSRWWDWHPTSGAPIAGRRIPYWNEVLALARRAHDVFDDQIAIGWDIAVLDDGPVLVEGNKSPDLDIIQRICEEPLGSGRFGKLFAFHLRRALAIAPQQEAAARACAPQLAYPLTADTLENPGLSASAARRA